MVLVETIVRPGGFVAAAHVHPLVGGRGSANRGLDPPGVVLAAIACFPLLAHRRAPLTVLALTTAASATINGLGYAVGPPFGPTIALFYVAADERTRSRLSQTAVVLLGLFAVHVGVTAITRGSTAVPILSGIIVWGGAWIAGDQLRQRRQRRADLEERARRSERDLERERRLAAAEERTRIARDLHDSAAHAINVILVQAGAARLLQPRNPGAVQEALSTIEDVARETIGEIDQLIRGLRENSQGSAADGAIEPPTGLAAVQTLAERHRTAGLAVQITIDGHPRPLAPGLDQAAYGQANAGLTALGRSGIGDGVLTPTEILTRGSNPALVARRLSAIPGVQGATAPTTVGWRIGGLAVVDVLAHTDSGSTVDRVRAAAHDAIVALVAFGLTLRRAADPADLSRGRDHAPADHPRRRNYPRRHGRPRAARPGRGRGVRTLQLVAPSTSRPDPAREPVARSRAQPEPGVNAAALIPSADRPAPIHNAVVTPGTNVAGEL